MDELTTLQHQINPRGRSQLNLPVKELNGFWNAQQQHFQNLLDASLKRRISFGGAITPLSRRQGLISGSGTFSGVMGDKVFMSALALSILAVFLLNVAAETEMAFVGFLSALAGLGCLFFTIKYVHLMVTGRARSMEDYQKEIGRSIFLEAFCQHVNHALKQGSFVSGIIDHRPHGKYSRTFAFQDALQSEPVESIEKGEHQNSFLWADLQFDLHNGKTLQLKCYDVVPESPFAKNLSGYRIEMHGASLYPNPLVFYIRPSAFIDTQLGTKNWIHTAEPQLFAHGEKWGATLASMFKQAQLQETA